MAIPLQSVGDTETGTQGHAAIEVHPSDPDDVAEGRNVIADISAVRLHG
jgi:hypothetical protein